MITVLPNMLHVHTNMYKIPLYTINIHDSMTVESTDFFNQLNVRCYHAAELCNVQFVHAAKPTTKDTLSKTNLLHKW